VSWFLREFTPANPPRSIDIDAVEACLERAMTSDAKGELFCALEHFGQDMVTEVRDRTQALDAKALAILGWTSASAALFLGRISALTTLRWWQIAPIIAGTIAALVAVISSFLAMRVSKLRNPSAADWCHIDHFHNPYKLRLHHLMSHIEMHAQRGRVNHRKGVWIHRAQWGLVIAATCFTFAAATAALRP
jgi:hypothetical protein